MHNRHTIGPTNPKLGTEDPISPVEDFGGWMSVSDAAVEAARLKKV